MDDTRLKQLESSIEEIRFTQNKIAIALLGSYEGNSVGLIEESRNLRKDLEALEAQGKLHEEQIKEVIGFKNDVKKVVAGIAIIVPFVFELLKVIAMTLWETVKIK